MGMFGLLPRPLGSIFRKLTHLTCNSRMTGIRLRHTPPAFDALFVASAESSCFRRNRQVTFVKRPTSRGPPGASQVVVDDRELPAQVIHARMQLRGIRATRGLAFKLPYLNRQLVEKSAHHVALGDYPHKLARRAHYTKNPTARP